MEDEKGNEVKAIFVATAAILALVSMMPAIANAQTNVSIDDASATYCSTTTIPVRINISNVGAPGGLGAATIKLADITLHATDSFGEESTLNFSVETLKSNDGVSVPYTVTIGVKGDYSGDDVKDSWDCTYLARHFAGIPGYETIHAGDISGDGVVDAWDCTYLARHLAGMPGYEDP